jgi:diguanylate cyclase (GGDEF)-like protein
MKLRHLLVSISCFLVTLPLLLFWAWPYSEALESEIKDVEQRHLVIAQNLSTAFERYYDDVIGVFSIIDIQSEKQMKSAEFSDLLASYHFSMVSHIDYRGEVLSCLFSTSQSCPKYIDSQILSLALKTVQGDHTQISTVTIDSARNQQPILLVVKREQDSLLLGYLTTEYIFETGKKVAFGEKGHAAIVDQAGNVLAHPLDSWVEARKNISAISAVQKMLQQQTGVEQFYSPALKGDMIAGYTYVPNANWGVMVPQPISELHIKASNIDQSALLVMLVGLLLALAIALPLSFVVIKPLDKLLQAIKSIESGQAKVNLNDNSNAMMPTEIRELNHSFSSMVEKLEANKLEISQLAFLDAITHLPNRSYFKQLFDLSMSNSIDQKTLSALVFIDLDNFKSVNDKYGHRAGDELLERFSQRLTTQLFGHDGSDACLTFYDTLPKNIPARLGGDEFVVLFRNIQSEQQLQTELNALASEVFATYSLDGNVQVLQTGSVGVVQFSHGEADYEDIIKQADMAMYDAKSQGKNQMQILALSA